jgi:hypothetical protein
MVDSLPEAIVRITASLLFLLPSTLCQHLPLVHLRDLPGHPYTINTCEVKPGDHRLPAPGLSHRQRFCHPGPEESEEIVTKPRARQSNA